MDGEGLQDVETFRGAVYPSDCDAMGHMNIASYVRLFDQAAQHLFLRLGFSPDRIAAGEGWADVDLHVTYKSEAKAGDLVVVVSRPEKSGRTSLTHMHEMRNAATGQVLALARFVTVSFDLAARASRPLPQEMREAVERWNGGASG